MRAVLAVIAAYIAIFIVIFVGLTIAYVAMGTEGAFATESFYPSTTWNVVMLVVGLVAAIVGGLVCAAIARPGSKAPMVLAIIVLVLGLAMAVPVFTAEDPGPRSGDLSNLEAMSKAMTPVWFALVNPVIGAVGVMVGASLRGGKKTAAPA